jgi:hypothetical protein
MATSLGLVVAGQQQLDAVADGEAPGVGHQRDPVVHRLADRHQLRVHARQNRGAGPAGGFVDLSQTRAEPASSGDVGGCPSGTTSPSITTHAVSVAVLVAMNRSSISPPTSRSSVRARSARSAPTAGRIWPPLPAGRTGPGAPARRRRSTRRWSHRAPQVGDHVHVTARNEELAVADLDDGRRGAQVLDLPGVGRCRDQHRETAWVLRPVHVGEQVPAVAQPDLPVDLALHGVLGGRQVPIARAGGLMPVGDLQMRSKSRVSTPTWTVLGAPRLTLRSDPGGRAVCFGEPRRSSHVLVHRLRQRCPCRRRRPRRAGERDQARPAEVCPSGSSTRCGIRPTSHGRPCSPRGRSGCSPQSVRSTSSWRPAARSSGRSTDRTARSFPTSSLADSPYPYSLALPQTGTERILSARLHELGVHVEYDTTFLAIDQDARDADDLGTAVEATLIGRMARTRRSAPRGWSAPTAPTAPSAGSYAPERHPPAGRPTCRRLWGVLGGGTVRVGRHRRGVPISPRSGTR